MMALVFSCRPVIKKAIKIPALSRSHCFIFSPITGKLNAITDTTAMPMKNQYFDKKIFMPQQILFQQEVVKRNLSK